MSQRYAPEWPQLAAYAGAVDKLDDKPVVGAAVFWADTGLLTIGRRVIDHNVIADLLMSRTYLFLQEPATNWQRLRSI
jgi:hypothetical protein